jgi:hypothetical protein
MTKQAVVIGALAGVLLCAAGPVFAQRPCKPIETVNDCTLRVRAELRGASTEAGKAAAAVARKTETGLAGVTNGLSSSMKDFLPLFQLAGVIGPSTFDEKTGVMSVALNKPSSSGDVQLRALIGTKPVAFNPLRDVITTEQADVLDKAIAAKKNQTDVTFEVAFNVVNDRLGRDYRRYQPLLNTLFAASTSEAADRVITESRPLRGALNELLAQDPPIDFNTTRLGAVPSSARREAISDAVIALQTLLYELTRAWDETAVRSGASLFGQMINNQPQLHLVAGYNRRDEWLGPDDTWNIKVTWEVPKSGKNVNAFVDYAIKSGCDPVVAADACAEQYRAFVTRYRKNIESGTRVALSGSVEGRPNDYQPTLPDGTAPYGLRKGINIAFAADLGGVIGVDDAGKADGRWDLSAQYERRDPIKLPVDDDEDPVHRFVLSATLTKKIGELSIPFGVVFANRSEYLTKKVGADYPISAHIGLKFNLFPAK